MKITWLMLIAVLIALAAFPASGQSQRQSGGRKPLCPKKQPDGSIIFVPCPAPAPLPPAGTLVVVSEPETLITVMPLKTGQRSVQPQRIPPGEEQVSFSRLPPGRYRVKAELAGYEPAEKQVQITARPNRPLPFKLTPLTYTITITTNAESGQIKYKAPDDVVKKVLPFSQGHGTLPNLPAGHYTVELEPDEISWQPLARQIEVGPDHQRTHHFLLERRVCKDPWREQWLSLAEWEPAPAGWSTNAGKLQVAGQGLALPSAVKRYCYTDFELISSVKMLNGVAASFVLRAQDRQNYYLIQLTGPNAEERYALRGFVVRDGVRKEPLENTNTIETYAQNLTDGFFEVKITAADNQFTVTLTDQTGDPRVLGVLSDPNRRFPIGAVGVAALDQERNEIWRFFVTPVANVR